MSDPTEAKTLSPADRSAEFVPVEGGNDDTSAGALLVTAYLVARAVLFAFVVSTWRKQQSTLEKLSRLDRAISEGVPDKD